VVSVNMAGRLAVLRRPAQNGKPTRRITGMRPLEKQTIDFRGLACNNVVLP
jgi:hypothetical protein